MLNIYRLTATLSPAIISYTYSGEFMGDRFIKASLPLNAPFEFAIGDYVIHPVTNEKFYLNYIPTDKKTSTFTFTYELTFVPAQRELGHCDFLDVVLAGNDEYYTGGSTVEFYGDLAQLRDRIQANLNRLYAGGDAWTVNIASGVTTDYKDISLTDSKVWDAVSLCKSTFGLNFSVVGRTITLGYACSTPIGMPTFQYGKGKGLYEITRTVQDDSAVVTRLRVFGGSNNIPADYNRIENQEYHAELMLPGYSDVESPNYKKNYIDSANTSVYGIREGVYRNEDIYPSIVGITGDDLTAAGITNTAVGRIDEIVAVSDILTEDQSAFNIWIKDLGFNPNTYLIPDETFTISMTTGRLAGVQFEITKCELSDPPVAGAVWKLTCNRNTDDTPIILPDTLTNASAADRFVLLNITLPQAYISASESRLLSDGTAQLAKVDVSKVVYSVGFDEIYMKKNPTVSAQVMEGILCPVIDSQLGINTSIIAQTVMVDYGESQTPVYQVTLSNEPVPGTIGGIRDEIENVKTESTTNKLRLETVARRNVHSLNRLKDNIFDTDDYFDGTNIRPNSIETLYLSVGAKSWDFVLLADIKPNYEGQIDSLFLSTGMLQHREIRHTVTPGNPDSDFAWYINNPLTDILDPLDQYYIYVQCSKEDGTAEWYVSKLQETVESISGYYLFYIGVIYPSLDAIDGTPHARGDSITYGKTWINGRFITTGMVQSADELCKIDLDLGRISFEHMVTIGGIDQIDRAMYWNKDGDGLLRVIGGIIQQTFVKDAGGNTSIITVDRGAYIEGLAYYAGNLTQYEGATYYCDIDNEDSGIQPTDIGYWHIYAAQGIPGDMGATGLSSVNGVLTNDSCTLAADSGGVVSVFTPAQGVFKMYYGATDVTSSSTFTCVASNCTGTIGASTGIYSVSAFPAVNNTASLTLTGTYGGVTITRIFSIGKVKAGVAGADAVIYSIKSSTSSTILGTDGIFTPSSVVFSFYKTTGATEVSYSGYINLEYSSDGVIWEGLESPIHPQTSYTVNFGSGQKAIRIKLYENSELDAVLDSQTVLVVSDGSNGTSVNIKPSVETEGDLPPTGNTVGDARIVINDGLSSGHLFMWDGAYWVDCGLIQGPQGIPGQAGDDGITKYTWIRYSDVADGTGNYGTPTENTMYVGLSYNQLTVTPNTDKSLYLWSLIRGAKGDQGVQGPSSPYQGQYSDSITYNGSEARTDVVRYGSEGSYTWYVSLPTHDTFIGHLPTETEFWRPFGSSFQSIATGTLLAEGANLAGFIFKTVDGNDLLISQHGTISGVSSVDYNNALFIPNLTLNGTTGQIIANNATIVGDLNSGTIGGFTIADKRIGVASSSSGLTLAETLFKYSKSAGDEGNTDGATIWAGIGTNVLPSSSGLLGVARFQYSDTSPYATPGSALITKFRPGTLDNISPESQKSIDNDGNIHSVGGHCFCDDTYIGAVGGSDLLEHFIGVTHQYMITSIPNAMIVRLPSASIITGSGIRTGTTFLLNITIAITAGNYIRLDSVTNGQLYNNNGQTLANISLYGSDTLVLRYYNGCYYIVSLLQ